MNHILSEHARKRCLRRKIDPAWIAQALAQPVRIESDAEDPELAHALWPVPELGLRLRRVLYRETVEPVSSSSPPSLTRRWICHETRIRSRH